MNVRNLLISIENRHNKRDDKLSKSYVAEIAL